VARRGDSLAESGFPSLHAFVRGEVKAQRGNGDVSFEEHVYIGARLGLVEVEAAGCGPVVGLPAGACSFLEAIDEAVGVHWADGDWHLGERVVGRINIGAVFVGRGRPGDRHGG